jgi:membrane protein implicated in regulation of membrane protease activity
MVTKVYNIGDRRGPAPERPLGDTVREAINEFKAFVETRIAMLRAEMRENLGNLKVAAPLLVVGALFGVTAWLLWTGALVAIIEVAFVGSPYGAFYSLICVGFIYTVIAACALWIASNRLKRKNLMPERTLNVLKEDKVWLQQETAEQQARLRQKARTEL